MGLGFQLTIDAFIRPWFMRTEGRCDLLRKKWQALQPPLTLPSRTRMMADQLHHDFCEREASRRQLRYPIGKGFPGWMHMNTYNEMEKRRKMAQDDG